MTIAHDVTTLAAQYTSTGTQTTSHVAGASARAAVVYITQQNNASDQVSGVTYGGAAMTRLRFDTEATTAGANWIYWLDNIATGTQNVAMTTTGTGNKRAAISTMTVTSGASVAVAGSATGGPGPAVDPAWSITGLTAGTALSAYEVIHSGLQTMTATPATGWTLVHNADLGNFGRGMARIEVASSGTSLACGWIAATSDDFVGSSVAFKEVSAAADLSGSTAATSAVTGNLGSPALAGTAPATGSTVGALRSPALAGTVAAVTALSGDLGSSGFTGTATLTGGGTLSTTGSPAVTGAIATFGGNGTLSTAASLTASGIATLSGAGTLTTSANINTSGVATLTGSGTLSTTRTIQITGAAAAFSGGGTLTTQALLSALGLAVFTGTGTLVARGPADGEPMAASEELQHALRRVSGTTLDSQGAANVWAGTTGKDLLGALNAKAATSGVDFIAVLNILAGTPGAAHDEDYCAALLV